CSTPELPRPKSGLKAGEGLIVPPPLVKENFLWNDGRNQRPTEMSNGQKNPKKIAAEEARQKRLSDALRQNLARRKQQPKPALKKDSEKP
ncbi:MAG: hypothetical protein V3R64_01095, partial [Sphingomonadales bacterium]